MKRRHFLATVSAIAIVAMPTFAAASSAASPYDRNRPITSIKKAKSGPPETNVGRSPSPALCEFRQAAATARIPEPVVGCPFALSRELINAEKVTSKGRALRVPTPPLSALTGQLDTPLGGCPCLSVWMGGRQGADVSARWEGVRLIGILGIEGGFEVPAGG